VEEKQKMGKNILVLTGSARNGGNSDKMADAFIEGALSAGHNVTKYKAARKDLKGCIYCNTCYSKGDDKACSHDDIFNKLAPFYQTSDIIVFATCLYWYTYPAQIKAAIDKYYSLMVGKKPQNIKQCLLLVCGTGKDDFKYEGIIKSYELMARDREWENLGHYVAPNVTHVGDIVNTDHLENIKKLGAKI
jgi:multimeric flavodoxin WrbA